MSDYVVTQTYTMDDQLSAAADRMTAAVDNLGTTVDATEQKVTKAGSSANVLKGRFDDVTKYSTQLATALRTAAAAQATLDDDMARGSTTADEASRVMEALATKVATAQAKLLAAQEAAAGLGSALQTQGTQAGAAASAIDGTSAALQRAAANQAALTAATRPDATKAASAATASWTDILGLNAAQLREWSAGVVAANTNAVDSIGKVSSAYASQTDAARAAAEAQVTQSQAAINAATGVNTSKTYNTGVSGAQTSTSFQSDNEAAYQEQFAAAATDADKLRASLVPLYALEQQRDAEIARATGAQAAGIISQGEMTEAVGRANSTFKDASAAISDTAEATQVAGYVWRDVGDQAHKFFDQIVAGGSALKAAEFQLPLIIQELGGFKSTLSIVGDALLGPVGIVLGLGTAVTVLGALALGAENTESRLDKLSTQLRATRTDAAAMATEVNSAARLASTSDPSLSNSDARTAATTIAAEPDFTGTTAQLAALLAVAKNVSEVFGVDMTDAAKTVATAMADPAQEAQDLADKHFPAMSQALATTVKNLEDTGDKAGAANIVLQALSTGTAGATEHITPLQKALEDLHKAFDPVATDGRTLGESLGKQVADAAATAIEGVSSLVSWLDRLENSAQSHTRSALSLVTPTVAGALPQANGMAPTMNIGPDGTTATGSGATGLLQIMPSSAGGNDITTTLGNINAGISILNDDLKAEGGNLSAALADFGGYSKNKDGTRNKDPSGYVASVQGQDISTLDPSIRDAITAAAKDAGTGSDATILEKLALQESGGHQFSTTPATPKAATATPAATSAFGVTNTADSLSDQADKLKASQPDLDQQKQAIEDQIALYQKATDSTHDYSAQIAVLQGKESDLLDPQAKITRGLTDQLAPLTAAAGYTRTLADVQNQFVLAARAAGTAVNDNDLTEAQAAKAKELAQGYDDATAALNRQLTAQTATLPLYEQGGEAIQHATDYQTAYTSALDDFQQGSPAFVKAVQDRTTALDALNTVQAQQKVAGQVGDDEEQIKVLQTETVTIGTNADARAVLLARMQAEYQMHQQFGAILPAEAQKYIDLQGAVAQTSATYQHQQEVMSSLQSDFSSIATTVGDDVTQAFVSGSGAAVNFGSIMSGIETQIVEMILKLAVLNPLMNSLFGGNAATLSDVGSLLGSTGLSSGSSTGSSSGGVGSVASSGGSLLSLGGLFGGGSSIAGILGTGLWGGTGTALSTAGMSAGQSALVSTAGSSVGLGGTSIPSTVTLGGLLGGTAAGFGAGSLLNSLDGGNSTTGTLGSGVGSLAGAAIGSIIPGVGTLIGGVAGGLLGSLGGLFSGPKKNAYANDQITTADGEFSQGIVQSQITDPNTAAILAQMTATNAILKAAGITITAKTGNGIAGDVGSGVKGLDQQASFDDVVGRVNYNSSDANEQQGLNDLVNSTPPATAAALQSTLTSLATMVTTLDALNVSASKFNTDGTVVVGAVNGYSGNFAKLLNTLDGQSLSTSTLQTLVGDIVSLENVFDGLGVSFSHFNADGTALVSAITGYSGITATALNSLVGKSFNQSDLTAQFQAIVTFTQTTIPDLLKETIAGVPDFQNTLTALRTSFANAEAQAASYGLSVDDLKAKESELDQQEYDNALTATRTQNTSQVANYDSAIGDKQSADLINFDQSAAQQEAALDQSWADIFPDTYKTMQEYQNQVGQLNQTLAAERTSIANENAAAVAGDVSKLVAYANGLATSSASPLSPLDQYKAAKSQYDTTAQAAEGGDYTAITELQAAATTFLSASQAVNGGGIGYSQDFSSVENALSDVGNTSSDALTNSYVGAQVADLKDSLVDQLQQLRTAVGQVSTELAQQTRVQAAA